MFEHHVIIYVSYSTSESTNPIEPLLSVFTRLDRLYPLLIPERNCYGSCEGFAKYSRHSSGIPLLDLSIPIAAFVNGMATMS